MLIKYPFYWTSCIEKHYNYEEQYNKKNHFEKKAPSCLTHLGRVTHICIVKLTIIGSDNGLSPERRQTIIWTNAGILLIGPLGTNCSENLIEILTFSFTEMRLKVSSAKWRPFCLGLNVLRINDFCLNNHGMEKFFSLLTLCEGNQSPEDSPSNDQPIKQNLNVSLVISQYKLLSKHLNCLWFKTPWYSYRHCWGFFPGVVSLTFRKLFKIFSRDLYIAEIIVLMRISCWNFVCVPKAMLSAHVQSFSLKFSP